MFRFALTALTALSFAVSIPAIAPKLVMADAHPPILHHVRYIVHYRLDHHESWQHYGAYYSHHEAHHAANHLRDDGYEAKVVRE